MIGAFNKIFDDVYAKLKPSDKELRGAEKTVDEVISHIKRSASKGDYGVHDVKVSGSFAKGTWLSGESDLDIFVMFNDENSTENLDKLVPKQFDAEFGTRKYFVGNMHGYTVQIVPLVKFEEVTKVKNSMDFSIMHMDYFNKKASASIRRDVMLLKRFCKSNDCFGSEAYIHGFSGYVLELLVINYGSFEKLLRDACNWKPGKFIDGERIYYSKEEAMASIGANENPLVLVDPTNKYRNVCGSLNLDNFSRFVLSAKQFLDEPKKSFFDKKDKRKAILLDSKKRGTKLFTRKVKVVGPKTVFFSKYNKALNMLVEYLKSNGINLYDFHSIYNDDDVEALIEVENVPSTKTSKQIGPSLWVDKKNLDAFLNAHKTAYLDGEKLAYDKPYGITDFNGFISKKIKEFISQKSIVEG